ATGDLLLRRQVQNSGSGAVSLVAGWDGSTGMSPGWLDFLDLVPLRHFAITEVIATDAAWGNGGGAVQIGDGTQTSGVALGAATGQTTVLGHAVELKGSNTGGGGYAQIGYAIALGLNPSGAIDVRAKEGGLLLNAGSSVNSYVQIGHRAIGG